MKKISRILYATLIGGLFLIGTDSCNQKEFLKVDQYSLLAADQMFKTIEQAEGGLVGCYTMMLPDNTDGDWGFKPNLFVGGHPTMDTQATGWDKNFNQQIWTASTPELLAGWKHAYNAITRCNDFLAGLDAADKTIINDDLKKSLDAQARGIRAFFYMWLAKTFGRVPMLATGENYINTPAKARAKDFTEMWNFIIDDLKVANDEFGTNWDPEQGQYGRITKGFALSFLGEAYMWKAYRVPAEAAANYTLAKTAFEQVIASGTYELNKSFTTLWDPGAVWTKECIWEEVLDEGANWDHGIQSQAHAWLVQFTACPSLGGWGSLYLSWEWWSSYEPGDKRREASGVTGAIRHIDPALKSATNYGYHPYLQQSLTIADSIDTHYHFNMGGEAAPSIWTNKYWRSTRSNYIAAWGSQQIYYKRYANVLLDYAECLFRLNGEGDATAWAQIAKIRDRAWGNTEVGNAAALTSTYLPYYQGLSAYFNSKGATSDNPGNPPMVSPTTYPLPFNTAIVTVPDAKTYYTSLKATKGFTSPVWLVALGQERRREFNAEWSLAPDLIRSGFIEDHITHNYPKGVGYPNSNAAVWDDWHSYRSFDFNLLKMDMPIPTDELVKNPLCDQNEAYK